MTADIFKQRGSALEDEFFRRVDNELAEKLREKWRHECDVRELQHETHIEDKRIIEELLGAGIRPCMIQVMTLIPAIHVAWANGFLENKERDAVLQAAHHVGIAPDSTSGELLMTWLDQKPSPELFQVWEDYIAAVRNILDPVIYRKLHLSTIEMARKIAEAAGGNLGISSVSVSEERNIHQIDEAFARSSI